MSNPVGIYEHDLYGEEVTIELWRPEDFSEYVREEAPQDAVCGCTILEPDLDFLTEERAHYDSEVNMIPDWAEEERHALVVAKLLNVSVLDSRVSDAYWLKSIPEDAPPKLVEKLLQGG